MINNINNIDFIIYKQIKITNFFKYFILSSHTHNIKIIY